MTCPLAGLRPRARGELEMEKQMCPLPNPPVKVGPSAPPPAKLVPYRLCPRNAPAFHAAVRAKPQARCLLSPPALPLRLPPCSGLPTRTRTPHRTRPPASTYTHPHPRTPTRPPAGTEKNLPSRSSDLIPHHRLLE